MPAVGSRIAIKTSPANLQETAACSTAPVEQYLHDYPFCWRAEEDPLIQYPRKSWFIRTTQFKDRHARQQQAKSTGCPSTFATAGSAISWRRTSTGPSRASAIGARRCRFGVCEETGEIEAIDSYEELLDKPGVEGTEVWEAAKAEEPRLPDDLRVHKPYIDAVTYDSPNAAGARMRRVTEVIDCWYDSGAMPFAQWGYPHQGIHDRVRGTIPRRFHQRSPRPDPRLVLQPTSDQHAAIGVKTRAQLLALPASGRGPGNISEAGSKPSATKEAAMRGMPRRLAATNTNTPTPIATASCSA